MLQLLQSENKTQPLSLERPQRAREAFLEYAVTERQRRQDSEINFNQVIFDAAVKLIERKLERMEAEGQA